MKTVTIYHNPACSKSKQALAILQEQKINLMVIDYLQTPLNLTALKTLRNHFSLSELVRTNDDIFQSLGLSLADEDKVLQIMLSKPILLQRPIIVCEDRAIIARPPELILDWLLL